MPKPDFIRVSRLTQHKLTLITLNLNCCNVCRECIEPPFNRACLIYNSFSKTQKKPYCTREKMPQPNFVRVSGLTQHKLKLISLNLNLRCIKTPFITAWHIYKSFMKKKKRKKQKTVSHEEKKIAQPNFIRVSRLSQHKLTLISLNYNCFSVFQKHIKQPFARAWLIHIHLFLETKKKKKPTRVSHKEKNATIGFHLCITTNSTQVNTYLPEFELLSRIRICIKTPFVRAWLRYNSFSKTKRKQKHAYRTRKKCHCRISFVYHD